MNLYDKMYLLPPKKITLYGKQNEQQDATNERPARNQKKLCSVILMEMSPKNAVGLPLLDCIFTKKFSDASSYYFYWR